MVPDMKRVLVITPKSTHLYTQAKDIGCEMFHRGWSESSLHGAIARMGRPEKAPLDLVVLDGHGNGLKNQPARYCSGPAHGIDLVEPVISARSVIFSMCFGGTDKYIAAAMTKNPEINVMGPTGIIRSSNYLEVVMPLIEGVLKGDDLQDLMDVVHLDPRPRAQMWRLVPAGSGFLR